MRQTVRIVACILAISILLLNLGKINAQVQQDIKIYPIDSVNTAPTYPGGIITLHNFLNKNINYPTYAAKARIKGTVYISFVVEQDGSLRHFKIEKSIGYGTAEEAIRVLSLSRRWNPGMRNGKPVRVKRTIPIKFSLSKKEPAVPITIANAAELEKYVNTQKLPLFKVDGHYLTAKKFNAINFNEFLKIEIINNPEITALHEKKAAKNGVIIARTKAAEKKFLQSIKRH